MISDCYSEEFNVEDSLRQGGGLSAILYAQHVGKIIENCVERKIGTKINEEHIPAVGWQDDATILAEDSKMEKELIEEIEKTAKKQRIKFSADKCKYIKIGRKKDDFEETILSGRKLEKVEEGKILGYYFNSKGNNTTHIEKKNKECHEMVCSMGLTIKSSILYNIPIVSMVILYKTCIVPKMIYGLKACCISKTEEEILARNERGILPGCLNVHQKQHCIMSWE